MNWVVLSVLERGIGFECAAHLSLREAELIPTASRRTALRAVYTDCASYVTARQTLLALEDVGPMALAQRREGSGCARVVQSTLLPSGEMFRRLDFGRVFRPDWPGQRTSPSYKFSSPSRCPNTTRQDSTMCSCVPPRAQKPKKHVTDARHHRWIYVAVLPCLDSSSASICYTARRESAQSRAWARQFA